MSQFKELDHFIRRKNVFVPYTCLIFNIKISTPASFSHLLKTKDWSKMSILTLIKCALTLILSGSRFEFHAEERSAS